MCGSYSEQTDAKGEEWDNLYAYRRLRDFNVVAPWHFGNTQKCKKQHDTQAEKQKGSVQCQ